MLRSLIIALTTIVVLASCTGMKSSSTANKQVAPQPTAAKPATPVKKNDVKFLDDITANPQLANNVPDAKTEKKDNFITVADTKAVNNSSSSETSALQEKYAALLETDPTMVQVTDLLKSVDEWYGTKYKMGGCSKTGIDCSAFVQTVYLTAFGLAVPRTAFEQFKASSRISATEMKQGDLVFFNTTGGVSHVGIYLGNNKFAHASVARGVTVSDLFDPYYLRRFLGVGRIDKPTGTH